MKPKIISIFNHKGGVAKTTSLYHISWKLTELGKKVLMVDADSQCNLSQITLGQGGFEEHIKNNPKQNIKDALEPAFMSKTSLIQPVNCPIVRGNENLLLLPGSMDLESYSVELGFSFLNAFSTSSNLPGSFYYLIKKTAEQYNCDYVLIDMNPSLGAINQDLLLSSHYFLIPTAPDFLSKMAVKSLSTVIPKWENWAQTARKTFQHAVYPLPDSTPHFLGYTVNDYNIRGGAPTKAAQKDIAGIEEEVNKVLVPALRKHGMIKGNQDKFKLGTVQDFQSTLKGYQTIGLPVWKLERTDFDNVKGAAFASTKNIMDRVEESFVEIVNNILSAIEIESVNTVPNEQN
ncbi:MAG: ParA family protein [Aureispira sp.]